MSLPSPPLTNPYRPRKLLAIRFLKAHLENGGLEQRSYELLYRIVMIISAIGREMVTVIQSQITPTDVIERLEWYAASILEGLELFRSHLKSRLEIAQNAATRLPQLEGVKGVDMDGKIQVWQEALKYFHLPTGNDARLFTHIDNHFDDRVYNVSLQFHREKPEDQIWCMGERFKSIQDVIDDSRHLCVTSDIIVKELNDSLGAALGNLQRKARNRTNPIIDTLPKVPERGVRATEADHGEVLRHGDAARRPVFNQSFSAIEEQVTHRGHFRSVTAADDSYIAGPCVKSKRVAHPNSRYPFKPAVGARRNGSSSSVPRIFTGSFSELEQDVVRIKLHELNPENETISPDGDPVKVIDFAAESATTSVCPSPATLLQRREALLSKEVQWASRVVNGEMVRSRRPSDRQRSKTIDDSTRRLETWLDQGSPPKRSPDAHGCTVKRGPMRQRDNTL